MKEFIATHPYVIPIAIVVFFIVLFMLIGYEKAPSDKVFLISGLRKKPKVLIGKAGIRIPFFERIDRLPLQLVSIDVKTSSSVPTADYINIKADAVVNIKISDKPIQPGAGANKKLGSIGDLSIMGIVAERSVKSYALLNTTRLNLVYTMSEIIAEALSNLLWNKAS